MKMRKTLAIIMAAALAAGALAGCSQATFNYSNELSNTAKWENTTSNIDGTINFDAKGIQEQINITATGYKAKDNAFVDMKFSDPSGKFNIPELKVYSDGTTSYINKSFYEGIYTLTGQTVPEGLTNMTQEYIGIDSTSSGIDATKLKALMTQPDGMVQLGKMIFGENTDLDLPFVQNGREYSLNLDSDKTVELAAKAVKAAGNNLDNINSNFKLGLPAESVAQMKAEVNTSDFDANLAAIKAALAGSTISSKETFTDTTYTSDFNMNLKVQDFGNISFTLKSSATKSDSNGITFPTNVLKVTQEEYMKMLQPANTVAASATNSATK